MLLCHLYSEITGLIYRTKTPCTRDQISVMTLSRLPPSTKLISRQHLEGITFSTFRHETIGSCEVVDNFRWDVGKYSR